jgi:hypothetical protein
MIKRRTGRHFSDGADIVQYLLSRPRLSVDRPFQPRGAPLPGATAASRDLAFLRGLPKWVPLLCGKPIRSIAEAEAAQKELLAVDLFELPIGIVLNPLSEDSFRGRAHATLADWCPDIGVPFDPSLDDEYLADPTDANLKRLDDRMATLRFNTTAESLSVMKSRSMLRYQHFLRTGRRVHFAGRNPMWDIGEIGRLADGQAVKDLGYPISVVAASDETKMADLRLPWFWVGWMFDPGLQQSGGIRETERADYFAQSLWNDGPYPTHLTFMLARKLAEQGTVPSAWRAGIPQQYEIQYSFLLGGTNLSKNEPKLPADRRAFRDFLANAFRMSFFLLQKDIVRTGTVLRPESQSGQVRMMAEELMRIGQPETKTAASVLKQIAAAKPLR